ncbi:MAG TPA: methionine--tRNA ligase [Alphaproteobacteria bacterium]|nr:methionine--tRNA ligase [Alphaproteobacteria bacterium]
MKTYYLTTPIYYVNDAPHIGHAYTTLACDVLARFMRLDGYRVHFLTGTDEHGQKVEKAAQAAGEAPKPFTDRFSQNFRALAQALNVSNDDFIRTTEARHIEASQAIWRALEKNGDIYLGKYAGWYAVRDEAFYGEDELVTGPDGKKRAPSGAEVEWVEEPSYFFKLAAWQNRLLKFYEENPDFVGPATRFNEVKSFVRQGLDDLSISRTTFKWGVPVPDAPGHIIYVWLDALTNYITAVGYPDTDSELFTSFWPADLHMVGKDILRFHAVYWPAFLMAAGLKPPKRVFAHGWWTVEGQKMSKSLGNVVDPFDIISKDKYGLDPVRYFLLREVSFGQDGDFSQRAIEGRLNNDLANDFGNLAQRVLTQVNRNCSTAVPQPGKFTPRDEAMLEAARALLSVLRAEIGQQAFHKALDALWRIIGEANRYVDEQAPWALKKTDPARMNTVLYVLVEVIRHCAILCQPFMPGSMAKLLDQLGQPEHARDFAALATPIAPGTKLPAPSGVFPRFIQPGSPTHAHVADQATAKTRR